MDKVILPPPVPVDPTWGMGDDDLIKPMDKFVTIILTVLCCALPVRAQLAGDPTNPEFIKATLVIADPGDAVYQITGHGFIRMRCQAADLDYVFTFESEDAGGVFGALFRTVNGKFMAVETESYIRDFKDSGRVLHEFPLNLKPLQKQRLWQVLDSLAATGEHKFNIRKESCSGHLLKALDIALAPSRIHVAGYGTMGESNAKVLGEVSADVAPWRHLAIILALGAEGDAADDYHNQGAPTVIAMEWSRFRMVSTRGESVALLSAPDVPFEVPSRDGFEVTPMMVALVILMLSLLSAFCLRSGKLLWMAGVMRWTVASALFAVWVYLVVVVSIPSAIGGWENWNFVLFNPAPLVAMIWLRRNRPVFIAMSVVFMLFGLMAPLLTDTVLWSVGVTGVASAVLFYPWKKKDASS